MKIKIRKRNASIAIRKITLTNAEKHMRHNHAEQFREYEIEKAKPPSKNAILSLNRALFLRNFGSQSQIKSKF